jgi:hypothetical protein
MIPASAATSDLVEFYALNNNYARMEYLKGWTTFKAGNYIFRLDCKIFSGTPTIRIGMDGTFGTSNSNLLNYTTKLMHDGKIKYTYTNNKNMKGVVHINI